MLMSRLPHTRRLIRWPWHLAPGEQRFVFLVGDLLVASIAFAIAVWLSALTAAEPFALADLATKPSWLYFIIPAWLIIVQGLHDWPGAGDVRAEARALSVAALIGLGIYLVVFFFAPPGRLPRLVILDFISAAAAFTLVWRVGYMAMIATWPRRILVVGAGRAGRIILEALAESRPEQYIVAGLVDDDERKHGAVVQGIPVVGGHDVILSAAREHNVDAIVSTLAGNVRGAMFQALLDCSQQGFEIVRMPDLYEQITGRVPIYHMASDWLVPSFEYSAQESVLSQALRRLFDLLVAGVGLILFAVVWLPAAILIWLDSGGPILYRQARAGKDGRSFQLIKFRTMSQDAEAGGYARWAELYDTRVTRVGRFLRRIRLDEAPQFWNVFKGDMGIIGPRPERPEFIATLEQNIPFYRARLLVKPGITGWAQVNYGYASTVESNAIKLQYDLYYIKHRSFWLDLLILWRTLVTIIRLEGT